MNYLHQYNKREHAPRSLCGIVVASIVSDVPTPPALRWFKHARTDALNDTPDGRYFAGHAVWAATGDWRKRYEAQS